jgi:pyridoxal 5'-phosphate synthase pdxT subunit
MADAQPAAQTKPLVGVLALQGGFQAHERMLQALGANTREVRVPGDLAGLDGLIIPGGESTTMTLGIAREGLAEPLRALAAAGTPILGSCAGLIMLDRDHLGLMDMRAQRNAFGRQTRSFEADVEVRGIAGGPIRAIFIRAPWVAEHGPDVEILGEVDDHAVAARQGRMLAVSFHAELGEDERLHRVFLEWVREREAVRQEGTPVRQEGE